MFGNIKEGNKIKIKKDSKNSSVVFILKNVNLIMMILIDIIIFDVIVLYDK